MKIGIFGGAFDPLHREHVAMLEAVQKEIAPDRLIVVPTKEPPHKTSLIAPFRDRVAMLRAVFGEKFEVSTIEEELGGKNYSLNLVKELKKRFPKDEILFILGSDSLRDLKIWHRPEELAKLVTFVSVPRLDKPDFEASAAYAREVYGAKVLVTKYAGENISSSVLKGKLLLNLPVGEDVPEAAFRYLSERELYRDKTGIVEKLKKAQSERLYAHSVRTALFALRFCSILALQFQDVFLASLLHDAAKELPLKDLEGVPQAVAHQFTGAETAEREYGVRDENILNAIRYHTTGTGEMTKLMKLVYAADKLEDGRNYPDADALRDLLFKDFDAGFSALVKHNYDYLVSIGAEIHPLQTQLYQNYGKGESD